VLLLRKLHVRLASQCLDYLETHVEACFSRKRPVRQKELTILIHDALSFVFNV
jgi:hypothetical protein